MRAEELMIGDIVRVSKDVCFKKGTVVEVRGIDADMEFLEKNMIGCAACVSVTDPDRMSGGVWLDYLEPIPLTQEILERNGFKHRIDYTGLSVWGYYATPRRYVKVTFLGEPIYGCTNVVEVVNWFAESAQDKLHSCNTNYIHQLQHALAGCGLYKKIEV